MYYLYIYYTYIYFIYIIMYVLFIYILYIYISYIYIYLYIFVYNGKIYIKLSSKSLSPFSESSSLSI